MKVYLSGPMTGYPDHNKAAFAEAAAALRARGFTVISPAELDHNAGVDIDGDGWNVSAEEYENYLARDLVQVEKAHALVFLPGWSKSGGAGREGVRALAVNMPLYLWTPDTPHHLVKLPTWLFEEYHTTERLRPESVAA